MNQKTNKNVTRLWTEQIHKTTNKPKGLPITLITESAASNMKNHVHLADDCSQLLVIIVLQAQSAAIWKVLYSVIHRPGPNCYWAQ